MLSSTKISDTKPVPLKYDWNKGSLEQRVHVNTEVTYVRFIVLKAVCYHTGNLSREMTF